MGRNWETAVIRKDAIARASNQNNRGATVSLFPPTRRGLTTSANEAHCHRDLLGGKKVHQQDAAAPSRHVSTEVTVFFLQRCFLNAPSICSLLSPPEHQKINNFTMSWWQLQVSPDFPDLCSCRFSFHHLASKKKINSLNVIKRGELGFFLFCSNICVAAKVCFYAFFYSCSILQSYNIRHNLFHIFSCFLFLVYSLFCIYSKSIQISPKIKLLIR